MSLTGIPGEIAVGSRKCVTVWNYEETKVVKKYKYFKKGKEKTFNYDSVVDVFLANNFASTGDAYLTIEDKKGLNNFVRVNVLEITCNQIFKNVTLRSQHIGDNGNSIVTLSHPRFSAHTNNTVLCYDRNLTKIQGYNTDRERPFTIVRCHPTEKKIACGDTSGRILIFDGIENRDELKASKSILH